MEKSTFPMTELQIFNKKILGKGTECSGSIQNVGLVYLLKIGFVISAPLCNLCPNLMNLSRGFNMPKTGFN